MAELEKLLKQQEELEKKIQAAMKAEKVETLKTVKELIKLYGFTENMLKDSLAAGRVRKPKEK